MSRTLSAHTTDLSSIAAFDFLMMTAQAPKDDEMIDATSATPAIYAQTNSVRLLVSQYLSYDRQAKGVSSRGSNECLDACRKYFEREHGVNLTLDNIALSLGILEGVRCVCKKLKKRQSAPFTVVAPIFGSLVKILEIDKIDYCIFTTEKPNFSIDPKKLDRHLAKTGSKAVLIAPYNPTGVLEMDRENAEQVAAVIKKHGAICLLDYAFIQTDWHNQNNLKHLATTLEESAVIITSPGKLMPLMPIAVCFGPEDLMTALAQYGGYSVLAEKTLTAALENNDENRQFFEQSRKVFFEIMEVVNQETRELDRNFCERFRERRADGKPYVKLYTEPKAGVVAMLDFSGLRGKFYNGKQFETGLDVAKWMFEKAKVATVPGECFFIDPKEMTVRIALGCDSLDRDKNPLNKMRRIFANLREAAKHIEAEPREVMAPSSAAALCEQPRARL